MNENREPRTDNRKMTSTDVEKALAKIHTNDFFITECKNGPTFGEHSRMDAVAIKKSWEHPCVTVYEVKVSRQDFLRDDKWPGYLDYSNRFYFACPSGLINAADIDDPRVGLIWVNENGNCITKKSVPVRATNIPASFFQYILYSRIDSDRLPFCSERKDYIREFINDKRNSRTLAHQLRSALVQKVDELEEKLRVEGDASRKIEKAKKYDELMNLFRKHSVYCTDIEELEPLIVKIRKQKEGDILSDRLINTAKEIIRIVEEASV